MVSLLIASRARGEYLRTHFKNMREVAAALTGNFDRSVAKWSCSDTIPITRSQAGEGIHLP